MEALTYFCPLGIKICVIFEFILIFPLFFFFAIFGVFSCDFRFTCFYSTVFSKFFMDLLVLVVLILWLEFRFESL
jgi:hypothetical protein